MYMLEKEQAMMHASLFAYEYFTEKARYLENIFKKTRSKSIRKDPNKLFDIQFELAAFETKLWNILREQRIEIKKMKERGDPIEEIKDMELLIYKHKQLIRISKTICDGIAWRSLKYDRIFFEASSRGQTAGSIDIENVGTRAEIAFAWQLTQSYNSITILNDLTRYLRIGDVTEVSDQGPLLHEIKKKGQKVHNLITLVEKLRQNKGALSRQDEKLLELQDIIINKVINIREQEVSPKILPIEYKTNFMKVKNLFKRSDTELHVYEEIEPGLIVSVTNYEMVGKHGNVEKLKSKIDSTPYNKDHLVVTHSNWDTFYFDEFGDFVRTIPPYSVFPFNNKYSFGLISGKYLVSSSIDIDEFKNLLNRHGWEIDYTDIDKQLEEFERFKEKLYQGAIFENIPLDEGIMIIRKGPFHFPVTFNLLAKITMELMTYETFLNTIQHVYNQGKKLQTDQIFYPLYEGETKLWN